MPGAFEGETVTRRRLMNLGANGVGAVAVAAFTLPALGFAIAPIFKRDPFVWQPVGRPSDFPADTYMTKVINVQPGIGEAGNTIAYIRARDPSIDKEPEDQYNRFVALSSRCMHLGCPVRYVPAAERFICPCHGGVYDFRGMVAGGPPVRPLDRFYTRLNTLHRSRRGRRPLLGQQPAAPLLPARSRASRSTASASTCIRPSSTPPRSPNPRQPCLAFPPRHCPKPLQPRPKRPGEPSDAGAPSPAEAGITVVDWIDERTSLSAGLRWLL